MIDIFHRGVFILYKQTNPVLNDLLTLDVFRHFREQAVL